ncbi:methylamine utilization protein [Thalassoroseus pseudoceratinae]|uniref:methylamine utilization protein n=1 Tax=Thalassoroseus pseudoceratinae TaxID=2713176 RepID=UPI0014204C45|nr:methylamine utilization protein [Thalassoroseus pseudoceratinae]
MLRLLFGLSLFVLPGVLVAEETGTLTGQFLYDGPAPNREKLELNKDIEYCAPHNLKSEELIVDPQTRGIKNIILWLDTKSSGQKPKFESAPEHSKQVVFDNKNCRFNPHISVLMTTQKLLVKNSDPIAHAALVNAFVNDPLNAVVNAKSTADTTYNLPYVEPLPIKITCPIHAWMSAYLVVQDHPFVAVTDANGQFEIKGLPPGEWTFRVWQESCGYVKSATQAGEEQTWDRGRMTVTIEPGKNAIGVFQLKPELFQN